MNLIPITMHASDESFSLDLATATIVKGIFDCARDFEKQAATLRDGAVGDDQVLSELDKLIAAYQAVVTCVLEFSIQSPRYGVLKDMQEDGGFVITL